ncbi:thioredoxin domain-containing protein [Haloplanus pelagicus]|jgi:protein-disulfide isomerase|uniref:thioredoxin domain-containing protein n=1 Tax=Haloplanus pelagicus TaxID=2949995 RepID=UPI00203D954B|nr:thioredoxin domain-containing protein [Haloplanus sp. HW8-1]
MPHTRREYLTATVGVAGLAATAGCLGGESAGTDDCTIETEPTVSSLSAPSLGPADADVSVVAFEDFSCPHCATFSLDVLPEIRSEYVEPGAARFEHRDFPIPVDERWSWQAASAARGVQDETDDTTFFEYAHDLFANQGDYSPRLITDLANDAGAPGCAIQADALNETYRPVVSADRESGIESGVEATPTVFVAGRPVEATVDAIAAAIDAER